MSRDIRPPEPIIAPIFKDKNGNFLYDECAHFLESLTTYKTPKDSMILYRYVKELGYYRNDGENHLNEEMRRIVGRDYRVNRFREVLNMARLDSLIEPDKFVFPDSLVNIQNGVFDLNSGKFDERTDVSDFSELHFTNCLPIDYRPIEYFGTDGPCPNIDKFMHEVFENNQDTINRMYEWIGYHFLRRNPFKKFGILVGDHDTAKTTISQLITILFGKGNISNLSMEAIIDDRTERVKLHNKYANISGELAPQFVKDTSLLKILTGNDEISARIMFSQILFSFAYWGKMTFLANRVPGTYEDDNAFYSRVLLFRFNHQFVEGVDMDTNILDKLTTPDELSGLFLRSVEALTQLISRGKFTGDLSEQENKENYLSLADSVTTFLNDDIAVRYGADWNILQTDLLSDYERYCKEKKLTVRSKQYFGRVFSSYQKSHDIVEQLQQEKRVFIGMTTIYNADRIIENFNSKHITDYDDPEAIKF